MNIFQAINAVMADCGFIAKDSKNQTQNYKYRGIDAVMNALNPALIKNHVFVVPEVLNQTREERQNAKGTLLIYSIITVKYTFFAEDGSSVSSIVVGEGMDSGDKATNKAMSAAFKYACFQVFCIPTEEMHDSEEAGPEPVPKSEQTIDLNAIKAIVAKCEASGIPPAYICKLCKVNEIADMKQKQFNNIISNWEKVVSGYGTSGNN